MTTDARRQDHSHHATRSGRLGHIAYHELGSPTAPPLFLLHGGTMTARWNWEQAMPLFAAAYRVIAPDSAGHGASTNPRAHLHYDELAEDVLALAAALGLEHAAFYGFSDGAQVALELAIAQPDFPTALVLSAVLVRLTPDYHQTMLEFVGAAGFAEPGWSDAQPELAAECRSRHDDWDALAPQVWELWTRPLELGKERLAAVSAPTLLLTGDRDPFVSLEQTVALLRLLPSAELAVVPSAGHEFDERFTTAALSFLARHAVRNVPRRAAAATCPRPD